MGRVHAPSTVRAPDGARNGQLLRQRPGPGPFDAVECRHRPGLQSGLAVSMGPVASSWSEVLRSRESEFVVAQDHPPYSTAHQVDTRQRSASCIGTISNMIAFCRLGYLLICQRACSTTRPRPLVADARKRIAVLVEVASSVLVNEQTRSNKTHSAEHGGFETVVAHKRSSVGLAQGRDLVQLVIEPVDTCVCQLRYPFVQAVPLRHAHVETAYCSKVEMISCQPWKKTTVAKHTEDLQSTGSRSGDDGAMGHPSGPVLLGLNGQSPAERRLWCISKLGVGEELIESAAEEGAPLGDCAMCMQYRPMRRRGGQYTVVSLGEGVWPLSSSAPQRGRRRRQLPTTRRCTAVVQSLRASASGPSETVSLVDFGSDPGLILPISCSSVTPKPCRRPM